jgi:hypothetical protein
MKIVVNRCFGGFGLSALAEKEYLAKKVKTAYFYEQTKYSFKDGKEEYRRVDDVNKKSQALYYTTVEKDLGDVINGFPEDVDFFSTYDMKRDDPDLVNIVEKLGESANGDFAELDVVEIPDDVEWEIDEYDGMESIHEVHRSW